MPSLASIGAGDRLPPRLPRQPACHTLISKVSGLISCFWDPIGSMWRVDLPHPPVMMHCENDRGGDISWRGENGAERKRPTHKARSPGRLTSAIACGSRMG